MVKTLGGGAVDVGLIDGDGANLALASDSETSYRRLRARCGALEAPCALRADP